MAERAVYRFLRPYLKWDPIYYMLPHGRKYIKNMRYLQGISERIIALRKEKKNHVEIEDDVVDGNKKRLTFMDLIMEASDNKDIVSEKDLHSLLQTFIFAVRRLIFKTFRFN